MPIESPVVFDSNGVTIGILHTLSSPTITILDSGDYEIKFSLSAVESNQFALSVNGVPVSSTVFGSGAGTQQNNGQVLLTLNAGDLVSIINHTSAAAVTLQAFAGGIQPNVNASVIIQKLN